MRRPEDISSCHPVEDLAGFLEGAWHLERRVEDQRAGAESRMAGRALWRPHEAGLLYEERVLWERGDRPVTAYRRYLYRMTGLRMAEVLFEDGRRFHSLDLGSGMARVAHPCGADLYLGLFWAMGPDRLRIRWEVSGPGKDHTLTTRLTRATDR